MGGMGSCGCREHQRILGMKFYVTLSTASFFILFTTSMLLFNFLKKGLIYAMQSNGPQAKYKL